LTAPDPGLQPSILLRSAIAAKMQDRLVCSDSGVPVYFIQIGTATRLESDIKRAVSDGFDHLVETTSPPLVNHVTNPLTNERGHRSKHMPLVTRHLIDGAGYVDITCQPKALGSSRWATLKIFTLSTLGQIEKYVMDCVLKAGSHHCAEFRVSAHFHDTAAEFRRPAR
jgi:fumarate hydratase subunit alpha